MIIGSFAAEALLEKHGCKTAWQASKEEREKADKAAAELAERETKAAKLLDAKGKAKEAEAVLSDTSEPEKRKAGRPPKETEI